jgi:molybdopterin/thiamine biosynthesis adenylyltransferase
MYLAAAGVGLIGIADADKVELSNLQRQIIHSTKDLDKPKVLSVRETVGDMNPGVELAAYHEWVNASNIAGIIGDKNYDFIIDATDNFPVKFLINDACVMLGKPFSHGGIIRFRGQLMTYIPGRGPCYRCVFHNPPPPGEAPACRQAGVLGVMGGVIGTLQATEALKYILGLEGLLCGFLLSYDALAMEFRKVKLGINDACPVCGREPSIKTLIDYEQTVCDLHTRHSPVLA